MDLSTEELSEFKKELNEIKDDMDEEKYIFIQNMIDKHFTSVGISKSPILKGETFKYNGNGFFGLNALMFILEKHKNFCKIFSENSNFSLNLITEGENVLIGDISEMKDLEEIALEFKYCIENGIDIIALPIWLPKHSNALIYRVSKNTFEHYEPNGVFDEFYEKITLLINQFINYLTENNIIRPGAILFDSLSTCPKRIYTYFIKQYVDDRKSGTKLLGLQEMESLYTERYNENPKNKNKIPEGLCQIWSIFYLDLCLTFPYIDGDILINLFINKINDDSNYKYLYINSLILEEDEKLGIEELIDFSREAVANFIYGYYVYIKENIFNDYDGYYGELVDEKLLDEDTRLTEQMSSRLIESFRIKNKIKSTKDFMCLNILNMSADIIYEFLYRSPDKNNIILNIIKRDNRFDTIPRYKNKTPIVCSSRDYGKFILINGYEYFNLIEGENIFINKLQMDIIKNKEYTFYQLTEEKKQKFQKYKTFYITKFFTLEDFNNFD